MSLSKVILEFQDTDIPKAIAERVSKFDSVGEIKLTDDYPLSTPSTEAYVYIVKTKAGRERVLRISRTYSDQRYYYDLFSEFQDKRYKNIVNVFFSGEVKNYDVTVMEKLERGLEREEEEEAMSAIAFFLMALDETYIEKVLKFGIIDYVYSDKEPKTKNRYELKHIERYRSNIIANIAKGGISEKATRDIANGIEEYFKVTNEIYDDLHPDNIMLSGDGNYKLIDL